MATTSVFRRREHPRDANGQFTRKKRPEAPDAVLAPPVSRQRVDEWVARAQTHTVVEKIDSPPGFLADCVVAPGAITVGHSPQEATGGSARPQSRRPASSVSSLLIPGAEKGRVR